jgi:hypothetical protein
MSNHIKFYFEGLFTSEVNEPDEAMLNKVPRRVTDEMNHSLTQRRSKKALFQIEDLKAPGLDGLHVIFYRRYWSMLGDELTCEVLHAVNSGVIPDGWNDMVVVIIPEVDNAEKLSQ